MLALGGPAIEFAYGSDYGPAVPVLMVIVIPLPLLAVYNLSGAVLDGLGRVKLVVAGMVAAAIVDLVLAIALVPKFDAIGAAIANACAQSVAALVTLYFLRSAVANLQVKLHLLARMVLVSIFAGGAAWLAGSLLTDHFAILLAMPAFAAALALGSLVVRPLPREDAAWIGAAVGERLGGRVGRTCDSLAGA